MIRKLYLKEDEVFLSRFFRIDKGTRIRFMLSPALADLPVQLFCNYPLPGTIFARKNFFLLEWQLWY